MWHGVRGERCLATHSLSGISSALAAAAAFTAARRSARVYIVQAHTSHTNTQTHQPTDTPTHTHTRAQAVLAILSSPHRR